MKVTVILLTYLHENYIEQALDSVLAQQTDFDYNMTIIEDCSPDRTREIVMDYARRYPDKIKLRLPSQNRNDNWEWMKAIDQAEGKYVALLDGDDYWTSPHKLQKQVDFLEQHPECVGCFHRSTHFYEDGSKDAFDSRPPGEKAFYTFEDLYQPNFMPTCSVVFKTRLFGPYPDWFNVMRAGDLPTYFLLAPHGSFAYLNEVMGATRIHKGGAWRGIQRMQKYKNLIHDYSLLRKKLSFMDNPITTRQLSGYYFGLAGEAAGEGELREARKAIVQSIVEAPVHPEISNVDRAKLFLKVWVPGVNALVNHWRKTSVSNL